MPYFLAESEAKQSDPRKEAVGAGARNAVEDLNRGDPPKAGGSRLSRRRHSCAEGRPWVSNGLALARTSEGVVLGEPWFAWEKEEGETALAESDPVYDLTAIDIRFLLWDGIRVGRNGSPR